MAKADVWVIALANQPISTIILDILPLLEVISLFEIFSKNLQSLNG
jgi:hypothetical protein